MSCCQASIKKEFIFFLKEKGVYVKFRKYFEEDAKTQSYYSEYTKMGGKRYLNNVSPEDFLLNAFDWENTEERYKFWDKLNREWMLRIVLIKSKCSNE